MATIDTVIQMQKSGMTDQQISATLQSQGISPREINEAINQAKIKNAISEAEAQKQNYEEINPNQMQRPFSQENQSQYNQQSAPMNPNQQEDISQLRVPEPNDPNNQSQDQQIPDTTGQFNQQPQNQQIPDATGQFNQPQESIMQDNNQPQSYPADMYGSQEQYPDQQYYQDGYYGDDYYGDGYYNQGYAGTETITEVAEQVFEEKFREFTKKTGDLATFKSLIEDKVENIEQRLKRIEETIDKLQHAIIQKIGEFGENTNMIKKDLENLHNTTSKLMNPLIDNYRELEKLKDKRR